MASSAQETNAILLSLLSAQLPFNEPTSIDQRQLTFHLVRHLAPTLPFPLLALFCGAYQSTNKDLVQTTIEAALDETDELLEEFAQVGVGAFEADKFGGGGTDWTEWARRATVHLGVARSCPEVSSLYGQSEGVLVTLKKWYDTVLVSFTPDSLSDSLKKQTTPFAYAEREREWLGVKLQVLETTYLVLEAAFFTPLADAQGQAHDQERSAFWDELSDVTGPLFRSSTSSDAVSTRSLFDRSLLEDLETCFDLSTKLERLVGTDARGLEVARKFRSLRQEQRGAFDGLSLLKKLNSASSMGPEQGGGKGKGKAVEQSVRFSSSLPRDCF